MLSDGYRLAWIVGDTDTNADGDMGKAYCEGSRRGVNCLSNKQTIDASVEVVVVVLMELLYFVLLLCLQVLPCYISNNIWNHVEKYSAFEQRSISE